MTYKLLNGEAVSFKHSHKKRKDSLKTRAGLAILHTYVENQAILEPILLYRASKCKQTKEQGSKECLWTHIFTFLKNHCQSFSFFCQDAIKTRSNCAIIGCNLSKKHKLTLHKTHKTESQTTHFISFSLIFTGSYLYKNLGTDIQIL